MNNYYLIPANSKKSLLILGLFNMRDIIILGIGLFISFLAIVLFQTDNLAGLVLEVLPGGIAAFLVFPIPNYHNTLTLIISMYFFFSRNQNYMWKGWCFLDDISMEYNK